MFVGTKKYQSSTKYNYKTKYENKTAILPKDKKVIFLLKILASTSMSIDEKDCVCLFGKVFVQPLSLSRFKL